MAKGLRSKRAKALRAIQRKKGEPVDAARAKKHYDELMAQVKASKDAKEVVAKDQMEQGQESAKAPTSLDTAMEIEADPVKPGVLIKGLTKSAVKKKRGSSTRSKSRTKGNLGEALKIYKKKHSKKPKLGGKFFGV
eukprot:gb/GEZN01013561.1/.p1 GENE.gb/GEZN01013561.1/~~gb/GEZN01013561.1/.p1  ORF type:complete len:136 (-),score=34.16 gb/GEZN01013561.1/:579-986(-)